MFLISKRKAVCAVFLSLILLTGGLAFQFYEAMHILESQYETGLIEINRDLASREIGMPVVHRIFSDIDEMRQLDTYALVSEIYDCYAEGLNSDACYVKRIKYNEETYDIFAYIFPDANTSMQYYENFAEFPSDNPECWYKWFLNPAPCFIAYDGRAALRIEGRSPEMVAILLDTFTDIFDIELVSAQELMEEALYSGQLADNINRYFGYVKTAE